MIDMQEWKPFKIGDLFHLEPTKGKDSTELVEGNDISYIGAKKEDNGLMMRCQLKGFEDWVSKGNCIVFICLGAGSAGYATFQPSDFIGMSGKTICGYNEYLTPLNAMFIVSILDCERPKYSFGRSWTGDRLRDTIIQLPATCEGTPDWNYMEWYIKQFRSSPITTKISSPKRELCTDDWKEFYLYKLFNAEMGNGIDAVTTTNDDPKYNYVSRDSNGNGVVDFVDEIEGEEPFPAGAMSLALGGSYLGSCFIQKKPFYTAQNVAVLQEKVPLSDHIKLFIATLIRNECKIKYQAFGRELNAHFRKDFTIKLPVQRDADGIVIDDTKEFSDEGYIPDWEWMDNYMKSLPYSDRI